MPELPEVETTRRGIEPHVLNHTVTDVIVRESRLRWPVPSSLRGLLVGKTILNVRRRGKYLLLDTVDGHFMVHLGMSGSLRLMPAQTEPLKHDHVDIVFDQGLCLRFNDPRRFGSMHWLESEAHPLLDHLGPEPLSPGFDGAYLYTRSRGRKAPVKSFVMDAGIVVGVGNIYANEALFSAGVRPDRACGRVGAARYDRIALEIRQVLAWAIEQGGTTLRDFVGSDGKPGYFAQKLQVYGRGGSPCVNCATPLREIRISNRSTVFCPACQR